MARAVAVAVAVAVLGLVCVCQALRVPSADQEGTALVGEQREGDFVSGAPDCDSPQDKEECKDALPPRPRPPTTAQDDDNDTQLTVSWFPLDPSLHVTRYVLQLSAGGDEMNTVFSGPETSWTTSNFDKHVDAAFRVQAVNCAGKSPWSDETAITATQIIDGPRTPRVVNKTAVAVGLRWWAHTEHTVANSVVDYRVADGAPPPGARSTLWDDWQGGYSGVNTEALIENLLPNTWYWFRLAFADGVSSRTWSQMVATKTDTSVPFRPHFEQARWGDVGHTKFNLSYTTAHNGGLPLSHYTVTMQSEEDDQPTTVYTGLERSCVATLTPGLTYTFTVTASNALGTSPKSTPETILCPAIAPEAPAAPVMVSKAFAALKVRWQPPAFDGGDEITRYVVERGDGLGLPFRVVQEGMGFEHSSEGLFKATTYRFRVSAVNKVGQSKASEVLVLATKAGSPRACPGGSPAEEACFNHGTCDAATATCRECDAGWVLEDCSGRPCPNDCTSPLQGTCDFGRGVCECAQHYVGNDCSVLDLSDQCPLDCNRGSCDPSTGKCRCHDGFGGDVCDELDCSALGQCHGHGECVAVGRCKCRAGYGGEDCAELSCAPVSECNGHGECASPSSCSCLPAYFNDDCSASLCGDGDCSGHGVCVGPNACQCSEGYQGAKCERPVCPKDCSGNGECVQPGQCLCKDGWAGMDCATALCFTVDSCSGRGRCAAPETCACDAGWGGRTCRDYVCDDDCSGHGACVGPLNCVCDPGWGGASCADPDCDAVRHCSGNGNCTSPNNCSCVEGWGGRMCDQAQCDRVKGCSGHGQCVFPQVCKCDDGFAGTECEQRTKPTNTLVFSRPVDSLDFARPLLSDRLAFTVEGWFNVSGVGARANLVSQRDVLEVYATRRYPPGVPVPKNADGDAVNPLVLHCVLTLANGKVVDVHKNVAEELGAYHYLAVVASSSSSTASLKVFANGGLLEEARATTTAAAATTTTALASSDFTLVAGGGVVDAKAPDSPVVAVSNLRVWSEPRSLTQVRANMVAGSADGEGGEAGLVGFWRFDDAFGAYAGDASGNKNTARLVGQPEFQRNRLPEVRPPSVPVMVEHAVTGARSIRVMWEGPEDDGGAAIDQYTLERSLDFVNFDVVYEGEDLEYVVGYLAPARFYAFRVSATNFAGTSPVSEVAFLGTAMGGPLPPKHAPVLVEATPTALLVSWARPRCNGSLLTNYTVQVMDTRARVWTVGLEVSVTEPRKQWVYGLLPGVEYSVRVRGNNHESVGGWSEEATMKTAASAPTAPQWGAVKTTARSVLLAWTPSVPNGNDVSQYVVERADVHARTISPLAAAPAQPESPTQRRARTKLHQALRLASASSSASSSSLASFLQLQSVVGAWKVVGKVSGLTQQYEDTSARPGMEYLYRVRADNDAGKGLYTETRATTLAAVPDAPSGLVSSDVTKTSARLSWKRPSANGPAVVLFRLEMAHIADPPLWEVVYEGDRVFHDFAHLEPGSQYFVRVLARNCKGWSEPSAPFTLVTTAIPPATPPSFHVRKVSPRAVVLAWTAPHGNGHTDLTYTVQVRKSGAGGWAAAYDGPDTNATVRGLAPATSYQWRVGAVSKAGTGVFTDPVETTTRATAPEPVATVVVVDKDATSLEVQWGAPGANGLPITHYEVYCGARDSTELHRAVVINGTRGRVVGLQPATVYRVRVRGVNAAGAADYAEVETATPPAKPAKPLPPVVLAKTATSLTLGWRQWNASSVVCHAKKWRVQMFTGPANATDHDLPADSPWYTTVYEGNALSTTVPDLLPNVVHLFRYQGISTLGAGEFSFPVAASTLDADATPPDSPTDLVLVSATAHSLGVAWAPQGDDNRNAVVEFVVEVTQAFPWDVVVDGDAQGWLQPAWDDDDRTSRFEVSDQLRVVEKYRGERTSVLLQGLAAGSAYGVRVRAVNLVGPSHPTPFLVFHTNASQPTGALVPEVTAVTATEIRVEWERPADGGSPIGGYEVSVDGRVTRLDADTRALVATDLLPGSDHVFTVAAWNALGKVVSGKVEAATLSGAPFKPPAPVVSGSVDWSSSSSSPNGSPVLEVTWGRAVPAGAAVTGYTLEMRDPTSPVFVPLVSNQPLTYVRVDGDVLPSERYVFRVFAHSAAGVSEPSEPVVVFAPTLVPDQPPPPRLAGVTATAALLEWDDRTAGQNDFEVRLGVGVDALGVVYRGMVPRFLADGLPPDTQHIVQLRGVNAKGAGNWSEPLVFSTETTCVGDDGSVCSGNGECVEGKCGCYERYVGTLCEHRREQAMCGVWGANHWTTVDGRSFVLPSAVGEHLAYGAGPALSDVDDEMDVRVLVHLRPLDVGAVANATAVGSVAVSVGGNVLTLATSRRPMRASNNVYVRLACGESFAMDVRGAFDDGLDVPASPFHVRFDAAKRFVVSVAGSGVRVVVQPFAYKDRYFLSAFVVDTKPRVGLMRGLCGQFAAGGDAAVKGEPWLDKDGGPASPTWVAQWLVDAANNVTLCPETTNPLFDTTPPVVAPKGEPTMANDLQLADMGVLSALQTTDEARLASHVAVWGVVDQACASKEVRERAEARCSAVRNLAPVFNACVYDVCVLKGGEALLAAHAEALRTATALNEGIESQKGLEDDKEKAARDDGSLTNGQQPLPVCPM